MRTILRKLALFSIVASALVAVSCDKNDDADDNGGVNFTAEDTTRAAQADNVVEGTLNIMENAYVEGVEGRSSNVSLFTNCAEITILPDGQGGTIIVDFGESCTLNNGAVVSGIINLEYGPFTGGSRTIDYTFQDFTYNNNGVSGGGQIVRQIANQNGNPQSTVNESIVVSFPGTTVTATRDGLRIAEWIEGVGSGTWIDNVYSITGNWTTQFTNGFSRSGEVSTPLIRKLSCIYLVSGILEIQQEGLTGSIDWGDGECDNLATLIFNGQEFPIVL